MKTSPVAAGRSLNGNKTFTRPNFAFGKNCGGYSIFLQLSVAPLSGARLADKIGMIQPRTMVKVADNTGAKIIRCFRVLGGTKRRYAALGDIIVASVREAEPRKSVKKGDVVKAVIIRQKKPYRRLDGTYIRFDDNAAVILEGEEPKGGRIFGPVARELREKGFQKIISLASEVV